MPALDDLTGPPAITPADLPQPAPLEEHARIRERWPVWLRDAFRFVKPCSVWVGGSRDLVACTVFHEDGTSAAFGHNRLARPVRVGISESWEDTVTPRLDQVPFWWQGLLARVWVPSRDHAERLADALRVHLVAVFDGTEARREFVDIGPDYPVGELEAEMLRVAEINVIEAWDDDALVRVLTSRHREARSREIARMGFQGRR